MNIRLFGDRVLLKDTPEETTLGGIALPENRNRAYLGMEVVAAGDGTLRGDITTQRKICVKAGDQVMVQVNPAMFSHLGQQVGGQKYLAAMHHDIIARVTAGVESLTLADFHPVGTWVLVRVDSPTKIGQIYLPDQKHPLQSPGEIKTYMVKMGEVAAERIDVAQGARVLLNHGRVTPMAISRIRYAYCDVSDVLGVLPDEIDPGPSIVDPGLVTAG